MRYFISITLLIAAVIHLLPLAGVMGPARLSDLYGITVAEQNLEILLRHRAILFGLLGAFLLFSAFNPAYQLIAFIAGFVSITSFLILAFSVGQYNAHLSRVVVADLIALIALVSGGIALALSKRSG